MKRFLAIIALVLTSAAGGAIAPQALDMPRVLPEREQPKATAIVVRGPSEGVTGSDYFFVAAISGDHGKPTWIVSPECDLSVNEDGSIARLRCDNSGLYTITTTVGGADASVAATLTHFESIDLDAEISQAVAAATATSEPQGPTLGQLIAQLPSFPTDHEQRVQAASQFALMSQRLRAGLIPSESDPLKLIQGTLGEDYRGFLSDVSGVVDQLRLTGEVTTAASFAPILDEVAAVLSE